MPSAIRRDHELADKGLVTVLMERQGADAQALQAFLMRKFPDNDALACIGQDIPLPSFRGIPHAALIGVDGTLLWDGSPLGESQMVDALIEAELAKVKKGWGDSGEVRKVRSLLFAKGDFAGAQAALDAVADEPLRASLQKEVEVAYAGAVKSARTLLENGYWIDAKDRVADLQRGIGRVEAWTTEVGELVAALETDAAKAGLAADKKLERAIKLLRDKKRDPAKKQLESIVKAAAEQNVAARAQSLLSALEASGE